MAKFLDYDGLSYFWAKIKALSSGVLNTVSAYTINGKKISSNPVLSATDVSALPITGGTVNGTVKVYDSEVAVTHTEITPEFIKITNDSGDLSTSFAVNYIKSQGGTFTYPAASGKLALISDISSSVSELESSVAAKYLPLNVGNKSATVTAESLKIANPTSIDSVLFEQDTVELISGSNSTLLTRNYISQNGKKFSYPSQEGTLLVDKDLKTINGTSIVGSGNITIDLTLFKVVDSLPTSGIDTTKIYLVKSTQSTTNNSYKEYIYNGDASATYDASKWEQLGEYKSEVDLTPYLKKTEAASTYYTKSAASTALDGKVDKVSGKALSTNDFTNAYKSKLDGITAGANAYTLPTATASALGGIKIGYTASDKNYPVALDSNGKAYVNVPWVDTNTTYGVATTSRDGLMSSTDKSTLDAVKSTYALKTDLATALTTSEINAICL